MFLAAKNDVVLVEQQARHYLVGLQRRMRHPRVLGNAQ